jgi:hypothetical protein
MSLLRPDEIQKIKTLIKHLYHSDNISWCLTRQGFGYWSGIASRLCREVNWLYGEHSGVTDEHGSRVLPEVLPPGVTLSLELFLAFGWARSSSPPEMWEVAHQHLLDYEQEPQTKSKRPFDEYPEFMV